MREIGEFVKLYKVKIPFHKHLDYYLGLLRQSAEFSKLDDWLAAFLSMEKNHPSIYKYKQPIFDELKKLITESSQYRAFDSAVVPLSPFTWDQNFSREFNYYISVDLVQANWSTLECFTPQDERVGKYWYRSWENFFESNLGSDHQALILSKSFRQYVLGNLNPNKSMAFQKVFMSDVANVLSQAVDSKIGLNADEIILCLPREKIVDTLHAIRNRLLWIRGGEYDEGFVLGNQFTSVYGYKTTVFSLDGKVKTVYDSAEMDKDFLKEKYKTLVGVPGNEFYMYFKAFILGQEIEERDCLFDMDGRLAKWIELPSVLSR